MDSKYEKTDSVEPITYSEDEGRYLSNVELYVSELKDRVDKLTSTAVPEIAAKLAPVLVTIKGGEDKAPKAPTIDRSSATPLAIQLSQLHLSIVQLERCLSGLQESIVL